MLMLMNFKILQNFVSTKSEVVAFANSTVPDPI